MTVMPTKSKAKAQSEVIKSERSEGTLRNSSVITKKPKWKGWVLLDDEPVKDDVKDEPMKEDVVEEAGVDRAKRQRRNPRLANIKT
jgi:hypothetical protein